MSEQSYPIKQPLYLAYLLRLWQEDRQGHTWRISLEDAHTGERKGFATLDDLLSFLDQQTEEFSRNDVDQGAGRGGGSYG
jgi:hypothetical protein